MDKQDFIVGLKKRLKTPDEKLLFSKVFDRLSLCQKTLCVGQR
jgi:hypothetical protein